MKRVEAENEARKYGFTLKEAMEYIDNNPEAERKVNSLIDSGMGFFESILLTYKK